MKENVGKMYKYSLLFSSAILDSTYLNLTSSPKSAVLVGARKLKSSVCSK